MTLTMTLKPTRRATTLALTALLTLAAGACADDPGSLLDGRFGDRITWRGRTVQLALADSCEQADGWLKDALSTNMLLQLEQQRRWAVEANDGWGIAMSAGGAELASDTSGAPGAGGAAPREYTDTNVQVEGVDEADLVKTDGTHIYTLSGQDLVIVRAWPAASTDEVARVRIKGQPTALHRHGDRLVVLSTWWDATQQTRAPGEPVYAPYGYYGGRPYTLATVVDAADPTHPAVVDERAFDGASLSTRRIDGRIYLVQATTPSIPGVAYWPEDLEGDASDAVINRAYHRLASHNLDAIEALALDEWLPRGYRLTASGALDPATATPLAGCTDLYAPSAYSGDGLLSVVTLDLDAPAAEAPHATAVVGSWGTVYASADALYVAATNWGWMSWWWGGDSQPHVGTRIHKFAFDSDGNASYRASGEVPGWVLNQFSLDEHAGQLRVASTYGGARWWAGDRAQSRVTCLHEQGGTLATTGMVDGLGKGEQIYSVRFVGDKGYVVTFRQVDPLYVIDLADPSGPAVAGELKIPGFSSYLHPLDADHLLTIGMDATETGQTTGVSFQIFDVSDPTDPKLAHKTVLADLGWSWSEAMYDHHAFVYYASRGLLAVPASGYGLDGWGDYTSRLHLYRVDTETGVTPAGRIDHLDLVPQDNGDNSQCYWNYGWFAEIRRSLFIEDFVYSISSLGMKVHALDSVDGDALVDLPLLDVDPQQGGYCELYW